MNEDFRQIKTFPKNELETRLNNIALNILNFEDIKSDEEYEKLAVEFLECIATQNDMPGMMFTFDDFNTKKMENAYSLPEEKKICFNSELIEIKPENAGGFLQAINVMAHEATHCIERKDNPQNYKKFTNEKGTYYPERLKSGFVLLKNIASDNETKQEIETLNRFTYENLASEIYARQSANGFCKQICERMGNIQKEQMRLHPEDVKKNERQLKNFEKAKAFTKESILTENKKMENQKSIAKKVNSKKIIGFVDKVAYSYINRNKNQKDLTESEIRTIEKNKDSFFETLVIPTTYSQERLDMVVEHELNDTKDLGESVKRVIPLIENPQNTHSKEQLEKVVEVIKTNKQQYAESFFKNAVKDNASFIEEKVLDNAFDGKLKIESKEQKQSSEVKGEAKTNSTMKKENITNFQQSTQNIQKPSQVQSASLGHSQPQSTPQTRPNLPPPRPSSLPPRPTFNAPTMTK